MPQLFHVAESVQPATSFVAEVEGAIRQGQKSCDELQGSSRLN